MKALSAATVFLVTLLALPAAAQAPERSPGPPGTVTLPLVEYDRLVDRATHPPRVPSPPPVAAVLARADLRLRAGATDVRGTFTLDGEVLRSGPTLVPLLAGTTVFDARLAGRPLPLVSDAKGVQAVVTGPGPFSITLEWGTPLVQEPGQASFIVPTPPAGSVKASLEVAGEAADVRLEPGLVTQRTGAGGHTVVEATLDPAGRARFSWSSRAVTATVQRESRFLSDVKTLVTVGEADLRLAALVDVTVVQGEPARFVLRLPARFEVTSVSGASLDRTEDVGGGLALVVREPARRRHQFLVTLERASGGGSFTADAELPAVDAAQRETGEAAIEGVGTLELTATETDPLRRMDVREASAALRGLAREALLAAFRYQRKADGAPKVALDVKRYPSAPVLAALAERAVITTLATSEGRTLTEVALTVRNHSQPFLKVGLPEGATLLTAEVEGEAVKPVKGDGGTRVPLLRAGFRPEGPYAVSFVYIQPGSPLAKKGDARLAVPRMDVPISVMEWEMFLPDRYRVKAFDGDALLASLMGVGFGGGGDGLEGGVAGGVPGAVLGGVVGGLAEYARESETGPAGSGQLTGRITDQTGAALPGVTVKLEGPGVSRYGATDASGRYVIGGVPPGRMRLTASLSGFKSMGRDVIIREASALAVDFSLGVGGITESVETAAVANDANASAPRMAKTVEPSNAPQQPSANVLNLQRRVAGVLPVRIDIPRAGVSYRFVRPLVVDEETSVSFGYKTR